MAVTKALTIRENPLLAAADPLKEEIDNYLTEKQEEGIYTRNSDWKHRTLIATQ